VLALIEHKASVVGDEYDDNVPFCTAAGKLGWHDDVVVAAQPLRRKRGALATSASRRTGPTRRSLTGTSCVRLRSTLSTRRQRKEE
jgi:hypothetical protein